MDLKNVFKNLISNKYLILFYFIFFIFLNIIDFLNIIGGDLDFFKKILSWVLIGYIFYKVSITKVFIGQRIKTYDLLFIFAFSLMSVLKSLILYSKKSLEDFNFFFYFLNFVNVNSSNIIVGGFIFGLLLSIIFSISLLLNHKVNKNSLIGSFGFKYNYFGKISQYLVLILAIIFFGIIVFNLFMEWFALAVDAIILVIGLLYYLLKYVHSHTSGKGAKILRDATNSGNTFLKKLISTFSGKKTIFIGISFLLALHVLVDAGVYLVPYTIGTQNTLYFGNLATESRSHDPLFSFFPQTFEKAHFYNDLKMFNDNNDLVLFSAGIFLIYITVLFLAFSMMILPFYILYKNITKKQIIFPRFFSIILLTSLFFYLTITLAGIDVPIKYDVADKYSFVKGVDVHTNQIVPNIDGIQILSSIFLFFTIFAFLLFRYDKYKFFFEKTIYFFVLLFFIYYIIIFFMGVVYHDAVNIKSNFNNHEFVQSDSDALFEIYAMSKKGLYYNINLGNISYIDYFINVELFSDVNINSERFNRNLIHNDYLFFNINGEVGNYLDFEDISKVHFLSSGMYDYEKKIILQNNVLAIYNLGQNIIDFEQINSKQMFNKISFTKNYLSLFNRNLDILRFIMISIFYIFAIIAFAFFYIRENLRFNLNK